MSRDDEKFLSRWSRRKLDQGPAVEQPPAANESNESDESKAGDEVAKAAPPPEESKPFDIASLPPIESIGANTDIGAFLRAGVPEALKREALRKVWVTDPAIRDFKGLQEYDWDFNTPGAIPGFGPIGADVDVKAMAERIFGGGKSQPPQETAATEQAVAGESHAASASGREETADTLDPETAEMGATDASGLRGVPDSSIDALQQENFASAKDESTEPKMRRHGSALPT